MGGIIIGDVIAKKFDCQFDIIIPRRILSPNNKELSIGSIMKDKTIYINPIFSNPLKISDDYLNSEKEKRLREIQDIEDILGKQIEPNRINGKNIILVDDGVATGATLILTSRWIRKFNPRRLIILIPICPKPIFKQLKKEADNVESLITPISRNFTTVGEFYQNFDQLNYKDVVEIVKNYGNKNT